MRLLICYEIAIRGGGVLTGSGFVSVPKLTQSALEQAQYDLQCLCREQNPEIAHKLGGFVFRSVTPLEDD